LFEDTPGWGRAVRIFHAGFASVMLCGLAGCAIATPKVDSAQVTNSTLPSMQIYNNFIGNEYWVSDVLQVCNEPTTHDCLQSLHPGAHFKVDGLVPNHSEVAGKSIDQPYFHIVLDDGRSGFTDATMLPDSITAVDPALAVAACKKKGDPKLGMKAAQVVATCWGPPRSVNTKIRSTGKFEQYVYGSNKFVYLHNGIVTSISIKDRSFIAHQAVR
jgi:hypothetical protein